MQSHTRAKTSQVSDRQAVKNGRRAAGSMACARGSSAEDQVKSYYLARGAMLREHRWRGAGAEIDLIFEQDGEIVFVEVKSSHSHEAALSMLRPSQVSRLCTAMEAYLGQCPRGTLTPMRFDVALLDRHGEISILPDALTGL